MQIQWVSKYMTNLIFEWPKDVRSLNGIQNGILCLDLDAIQNLDPFLDSCASQIIFNHLNIRH